MNVYRVDVRYVVVGIGYIYANSLEEAEQMADNRQIDIDFSKRSEPVNGSEEVDGEIELLEEDI